MDSMYSVDSTAYDDLPVGNSIGVKDLDRVANSLKGIFRKVTLRDMPRTKAIAASGVEELIRSIHPFGKTMESGFYQSTVNFVSPIGTSLCMAEVNLSGQTVRVAGSSSYSYIGFTEDGVNYTYFRNVYLFLKRFKSKFGEPTWHNQP